MTRVQVDGKVVLCDAFAPADLVAETLSQSGDEGFILTAAGVWTTRSSTRACPPPSSSGAAATSCAG
jgi:hypothetical protein